MFHKLQIKLVCINLGIIAALFFLLTIGAYFFLQNDMVRHTKEMSDRMATDINSGHFRNIPPPDDIHGPNVFFIKVDPAGTIIFSSAMHPTDQNNLDLLVQETLRTSKWDGPLNIAGTQYFYTKTPLLNEAGTLLIFHDFEREKALLHTLVVSLTVIGFICLILSLLGSLLIGNKAMIPIRTAWQQQRDFLADASHELRTPLAVIQTNLEIVLSNPTELIATQNKWLNNIKEESEQMAKLINSLLFLARADAKQQTLDKLPFSLAATITDTIEAFNPIAAAKQVQLKMSIVQPAIIYGDNAKIRQVLEILLDNAIRHTPAGGNIAINLSQLKKKVTITVTDTGEGIKPEHLEKIFNRFYQVDSSRSTGKSGLGLAIAKCIIENHGGTIQATSTPGVGTAFIIQLPQDNLAVPLLMRTDTTAQS